MFLNSGLCGSVPVVAGWACLDLGVLFWGPDMVDPLILRALNHFWKLKGCFVGAFGVTESFCCSAPYSVGVHVACG